VTEFCGRVSSLRSAARIASVPLLLISVSLVAASEYRPQAKNDRKPVAGRTLVFVRGQFKYPLFSNYYRAWLDRPLLHDRSLRDKSEPQLHVNSRANFARMVEVARSYELDGFAFFPTNAAGHFMMGGKNSSLYELGDSVCGEGFGLIPEVAGGLDLAACEKVLAEALASKSVQRIGGKVVLSSYGADSKKPAQWKAILAGLRAKHGDCFLFLPDITRPAGEAHHKWAEQLDSGKPIPETDLRAIQAYLRAYLDVCDGLYFAGAGHLRTEDRKFHDRYYREFLIPLFQGVLAEPAYRSKLLGLSAAIGYFRPESGSTTDEDGTKTLRSSFEAAMNACPDLINLPEWDEENENTFFRPTVYNSFSTQRIVRYYMRRIKGDPPAPNPGDDTSIPNLIVSYRKMLVLGERLEIELLNVPDSDRNGTFTVTVALKDIAGRTVKQFPPQTLAERELGDRTLVVPTEELASHTVLVPVIEVSRGGRSWVFEEGLHYIHLQATSNFDLKWVKQPLRDLCRPTTAQFSLAETADPAERTVAGSFACGEKLAFLEVLENDDTVFAADRQDEYLRDHDDMVLVAIERRAMDRIRLIGKIEVVGSACRWLGEDLLDNTTVGESVAGNTWRFNTNVDQYVRCAYVAIPKADADKASLMVDSNRIKTRVSVKQVLEKGICSQTYEDGLSLTVSRYVKQPKVPYRLNRDSASFSAVVRPEMRTSVFHMRAITESGKVYFGRPVVLPDAADGKTAPVSIYSDTAGKAVTVAVDAARIPKVLYDFSPERGSLLWTSAGRSFWGVLGGFSDLATGRGTNSSTPFRDASRNYPDHVRKSAPEWIEEDGKPCLKFDGMGQFVLLPVETLPRRAGFALSFQIKPTSEKPQVLFICHSSYIGSLAVRMNAGKLSGSYNNEAGRSYRLEPGLSLDLGKWSQVDVIYDQATIRFRVNGKESAPMPCPGPGLYIATSVLGGFGDGRKDSSGSTGWFEGYLRSLEIRHGSQ
jgi:hypothetical protein